MEVKKQSRVKAQNKCKRTSVAVYCNDAKQLEFGKHVVH